MIKLVDARKNLHEKCVELFHNEKVAESIYMYLCNGIEECDVVEPERKKGKWIERWHENKHVVGDMACSVCGAQMLLTFPRFCPNCGADMRVEEGGK